MAYAFGVGPNPYENEDNRRISNTMAKDRELKMADDWANNMPCKYCAIKDVCKHANGFPRPDFNHDVFVVQVTCTLFDKFNDCTPKPNLLDMSSNPDIKVDENYTMHAKV